MPSPRYTLGLDIGGTNIKSVVLNTPGEIAHYYECASDACLGPERVRSAILRVIHHYTKENIVFESIGIGCAGSVDSVAGLVRNSPNFLNWKNVPLGEWIEHDAELPVVVHNDGNCAVFAEWVAGNAMGSRNVVLLTFGTGIGGGLILDKKMYLGGTGSAAELGHFSIEASGKSCPCGNVGCFEEYCSATALQSHFPGLTAREIMERASEQQFQSIVGHLIRRIKVALTSLANIFDPEVVLFGGAMAAGLTPYFGEILAWVRSHAFPAIGEKIVLKTTRFGNQSGAMGAALLSMNHGAAP